MSTVVDVATICALVVGPSLAVGLSLWIENRRKDRADKMAVLRTLMATRINAADPNFQATVTMVPIVFSKVPAVLTKWDDYIAHVSKSLPEDDQMKRLFHEEGIKVHDRLCDSILSALGFPERDRSRMVQTRYFTQSYIDQQTLLISALKGIPAIAEATQRMASANETIVSSLPERNTGQPAHIERKR